MAITDKGKSVHIIKCSGCSYSIIVATGAEAVAILSNRVSQVNVQTRFMADKNTWPPEQSKSFTPLLLVHYQGYHTPEQVAAMAELMYTGNIDEVVSVAGGHPNIKFHPKQKSDKNFQKILDTSTATKEIKEILTTLENNEESCFVLIEGAPGVGKSVLLKEIAYRWGKTELLQKFKLVLLVCLRDPSLQQIKCVDDLLQLFYKGDKDAAEIVRFGSQYLSRNGGKNVTLLLDGYDEYPRNLQESSLIADILQRQVLPLCGLIVSSRPHASVHLRQQATIRVDILGFTEIERQHYIKQALPDQPHKVRQLTEYLYRQPSIDSICFIPFNMVILLYLYKIGIPLPKNCTELYHHFIYSTICRHACKFGNSLTQNIPDLTNLPEPYSIIIKQLSKLSLEALSTNKLIFTLDEITAACPGITTIPGAINGFGLLQAVQHVGLYMTTMTLNFTHFTIQEFLAAHYISHLPMNEELKVIKENFWSDTYFNMFSIYVSLTKGQRYSFKQFLSGGNKAIAISPEFLKDQLKCVHLYQCFSEADDHVMCYAIEQAEIFRGRNISPVGAVLTPNDLESISVFLTSSFNEWEGLNFWNCYIQDKGLNILYRRLRYNNNIAIKDLYLRGSGLTIQSSSLISELTIKYKVKMLDLSHNYTIGEDQRLYSMLTDLSNTLETLIMYDTKLSSKGAIALFKALKDNNKLKELNITHNGITDEACDAITTALENNKCLVTLSISYNPLSDEAIVKFVQCLEVNNVLQVLGLPYFPLKVQEKIRCVQETVNKKRERKGYQVTISF